MPDRIRTLNHKGVKIILHDYSGLEGKPLLDLIEQCVTDLQNSGRDDNLLMVNVQNTEVSKASQIRFAEAGKQVHAHCRKMAVIGLDAVKETILSIINKITGIGAKGFSSEQEAREWLIQD